MLGAIAGDVIGSRFEWHNHKSKDFALFGGDGLSPVPCEVTDDTIMTLAVATALHNSVPYDGANGFAPDQHWPIHKRLIQAMHTFGWNYPDSDYGGNFAYWLRCRDDEPYNSFGNGAAMRVSPAGWLRDVSLEDVERVAMWTALTTHNHPHGINGAQATAAAIYMARKGASKEEIRDYIRRIYYPDSLDRTLAQIRPDYEFDSSCQGTVPPALIAFFESDSFEDAIRNAVSLGGDSDTLACITGSVAEAFYGIPEDIQREVIKRVVPYKDLFEVLCRWEHSTAVDKSNWISFDEFLN